MKSEHKLLRAAAALDQFTEMKKQIEKIVSTYQPKTKKEKDMKELFIKTLLSSCSSFILETPTKELDEITVKIDKAYSVGFANSAVLLGITSSKELFDVAFKLEILWKILDEQ